ncbi:hypothetical protein BDN70DRAFT_897501 [Pholiota conissans]|uniref:Uncharacterized protein n=1 Tax=Pholiota conissans TaxID=109636 RepID=A0A9P5YYJ5_9AGAR|nr:hypothetical protein BDN70DRAFT_897501 [Pholiota conissans]
MTSIKQIARTIAEVHISCEISIDILRLLTEPLLSDANHNGQGWYRRPELLYMSNAGDKSKYVGNIEFEQRGPGSAGQSVMTEDILMQCPTRKKGEERAEIDAFGRQGLETSKQVVVALSDMAILRKFGYSMTSSYMSWRNMGSMKGAVRSQDAKRNVVDCALP